MSAITCHLVKTLYLSQLLRRRYTEHQKFVTKKLFGFIPVKEKQPIRTITLSEFESAMKLAAYIACKYKLVVDRSTVMTHYEFGIKHPSTSSYGKPDITFIPPYPWVSKNEAGDFIRSKIRWYKAKMKEV